MKRFNQLLAVVVVAITLSACGGGSGGDNGGSNSNRGAYSESELLGDHQNVDAAEESLEAVGLKFKTEFDYRNGVSTYSFDQDFLRDHTASNPSTTDADMISALENFVRVAEGFLKKYSGTFNINQDDGEVKAMSLRENVRREIEAKVDVAEQVIAAAKNI